MRWTLTGVLRVFREIRFYLHKEFRAAEIGFSLHKEFHKKMGAMLMKIVILSKENWSHMDNFMKFHGGDATENHDFQRRK